MEADYLSRIDLVQALMSILFSGFIFFAIRALRKIDLNQNELFTRLHSLEKDFYELSGEHKANIKYIK
jgi:hypothetical protein